jgi:ribonuclease HI
MPITIFSDGSFSEDQGLGAYAFYIRGDDMLIKKADMIPGPVYDSNLCELYAIAMALRTLSGTVDLKLCDIVIRTDSLTSKSIIYRGTQKNMYMSIRLEIKAYLSQAKSYRIRHVKAHKWNKDDEEYSKPKYYVNRWCDQQAHRLVRAAVRKVENEKDISKRIKLNKKRKTPEFRPQTRRYSHRIKGRGAGPYRRARTKINL